ncbi:hypothetical protein QE386_001391 [Pseudoxanthomonas winnipegensis]|nr:hypothetical protein [Pseudoxanthomonas winnipegensis]
MAGGRLRLGRRARRRLAEVHGRGLRDLRLVGDREVGLLLGAGHLGRQRLRELADIGVVVLHGLDVAAAGHGDAVLGAFQLRLQVAEVLVGLQGRIVLADHQQAAQRAAQLALRLGELLQRVGVIGVDLDLADPGAGVGDLGQHLTLLLGVALHGAHQVGDQVGAALVLVEHLGPAGLHRLILLLDGVVPAAGQQRQGREHQQGTEDMAHGVTLLRGRPAAQGAHAAHHEQAFIKTPWPPALRRRPRAPGRGGASAG